MLGGHLRHPTVQARGQELWEVIDERHGEGQLVLDRRLGHPSGHADLDGRSSSGVGRLDPVGEVFGPSLLGEDRGLHIEGRLHHVDGAVECRDPIDSLVGGARVGPRPEVLDQLAHQIIDHVFDATVAGMR